LDTTKGSSTITHNGDSSINRLSLQDAAPMLAVLHQAKQYHRLHTIG
jgi:hypothetical protein